jgi:hypothetical protein
METKTQVDERACEELARRAAEMGFSTTADDYRNIQNRLTALQNVLNVVRSVDVTDSEPANTFQPGAPGRKVPEPKVLEPKAAADHTTVERP